MSDGLLNCYFDSYNGHLTSGVNPGSLAIVLQTILTPVVTEAPSEANFFKLLSSNRNLEIRLIRQLCLAFASTALVSENCSRSVESINALSAFPF